MNTCDKCKWWVKGGYFTHGFGWIDKEDIEVFRFKSEGSDTVCMSDPKDKFGLCLHEKIGGDTTDSWLHKGKEIDRSDGVHATSYDDRGCLSVGPKFGCIHWEAKPSKA